jgi:hypothetical protein
MLVDGFPDTAGGALTRDERTLGRIDIHLNQIMAAARWAKPRKWAARLS